MAPEFFENDEKKRNLAADAVNGCVKFFLQWPCFKSKRKHSDMCRLYADKICIKNIRGKSVKKAGRSDVLMLKEPGMEG